jgi:hypothetical protein
MLQNSITEAINEYYKLKQTYENNIDKDKKKILNNNSLTINEKKKEFKLLKPKCINCKRPVGTIFLSKYNDDLNVRQLKSLCGDLNEPCNLNILINLGECYNVKENIHSLENDLINEKNEIINDKNNLLFGYISQEMIIKRFNELQENIEQINYLLNYNYEFLFKSIENKAKQDELNKLIENAYIFINKIKETIQDYNNSNLHIDVQLIRDAVEIYVNELEPLLREIMNRKYAVNFVEFNETDNKYYLIQRPNSILQMENYIVTPTVIKFDIGFESNKDKNKNKTKKNRNLETKNKNQTKKNRDLQLPILSPK